MTGAAWDFIDIVAERESFLQTMDTAWVTKPELESALSVSRSTVDRSLRDLERWSLVERDGVKYRRTGIGSLVLDEFEGFQRRMAGIERALDALTGIEPDGAALDGSVFENATVNLPDRNSLRRPADELNTMVAQATSISTIAAGLLPQLVESYHRRLGDDIPMRVLLSDALVTRLLSAYRAEFTDGLRADTVEIRKIGTNPSYSTVITETPDGPRLGLLFFGETEVRGFLGTHHAPAIDWARCRFETLWERSPPLVKRQLAD